MRVDKCRGFTPRWDPYGNEPFQAARSVCDLPSGYYRRALSDPIILLVIKNQVIFCMQLRQLKGGKGRNEQVNIHTMTFICHTYALMQSTKQCRYSKHECNAMNGGQGQDTSKQRPTAVCLFIIYMHLTVLLSGQGATTFIQRKPQERKGQNWTHRPLMFAELWRPQ